MSDPAASETRQWDLHPETEYRFELDPGTTVAIKLLRGQAEIYGCELAEGKSYLFGEECKAAVFTWRGASIEMKEHVIGRPSVEYTSDETPMAVYANLHIALEQMRVRALANIRGSPIPEDEGDPDATSEPPRVLILGPENSGKTSLCKMLVNYASRVAQGWAPVVANLDPAEGAFALPGAISAAAIPAAIPTCTPAATLGLSASSAPMAMAANALVPLVYWYGHPDAKRNPRLLERLIRNLGMGVSDREDAARNNVKDSASAYASGFIVDTPSSFASSTTGFNEHRQRLIKAAVEAFRSQSFPDLISTSRCNAPTARSSQWSRYQRVVELDAAYRERVHKYQMHTYFYGHVLHPPPGVSNALLGGEAAADLVLSPSSTVIGFGDLSIYRIGAESMAPTSALSIGAVRLISEMQPVQVDPSAPGSGLLNALLAVLAPLNPDENERYDEELLDLTVSGFIAVTSIDVQNKQMTVLCPNQGSVVGRTALMGSFEWQEQ
ncbi:hypothetical protein GGF50DRAFT_96568 [Schizophyllum commune]